MPNQPFLVKPGVNTQQSPLLLGQGWSASNLVRFKDGLLQSLGGCTRLTSQTFVGTCRGLRPFYDLSGETYIGIGTTDRLAVLSNAIITDITPVRATVDAATPFATTASSQAVTVADATAVLVGDWVSIPAASYVGGLFLQGIYQITALGAGQWQFNAGADAGASVVAGGAMVQFTTTTGSHVVVVAIAGFTFSNGQDLTIGVPTTVGGLTMSGIYTVTVSGGVASIQSATPAASGASAFENGGNVRLDYLLETSVEMPTTGYALFGQGAFGAGPFGVGSTSVPIGGWERQWSLDAFGQDLIANPTDGGIYVWTPPVAVDNPAVLITEAPAVSVGCFVTAPSQQIMAFGCTDPNTGNQDPLLLAWCDVDDYTDWTATATNQAGTFRISAGGLIVGALQAPGQVLVWTDLDLWEGQYIGFPLVWGFNRIGQNCGLRSRRGMIVLGGMVFWISQNGFFVYNGAAVQPLRCDVWDFIFNNIDGDYPGSVHFGGNTHFGEWFCFFPTVGSAGVANAYVKNNLDNLWDCGYLPRSAWYDQSVAGNPVAADYTGLLQAHETSTELDGAVMDCWAQSGWVAIAEGAEFVSLKYLLPDFVITGTEQITVTVSLADYTDAAAAPRTYGPYAVTSSTRYLWVHGRGRYASIKVESNAAGLFWRLGKIAAVIAPDGRR